MTNKTEKKSWYADIPPWEWAISGVGLFLVLGLLGFLLYESITEDPTPPDILIHQKAIHRTQAGYLVTLRVQNQGGTTAAKLTIEGKLQNGEKTIETSSVTLDYVPAGSEREAGLFFTSDPKQGELQLRPTGFEVP